MRAGAYVLPLAGDPINRQILETVLAQPIEASPGKDYEVSESGREALAVAVALERWLERSGDEQLAYGSEQGQRAIELLAETWSAGIVHLLAREPHGIDELHSALSGLSRRALKRQLAEMEAVGQIIAFPAGGESVIYMLTDWMRAGIAPLIVAARLERRDPIEGMAPIDTLDVEAGFRMSLPLVELPEELNGSCRLGLNLCEEDAENAPGEPPNKLTGVSARIEHGKVVSCEAGLDKTADAWAAGTANAWLDTVIDPKAKALRTGGDAWLTKAVIAGLHQALFGGPKEQNPTDRELW
jgi:DNA-binding HxlR family transcriptional regulator